jgi:hypothetical protein
MGREESPMFMTTRNKVLLLLTAVASASSATGCRKSADDESSQVGAAIGELMSSVDESSQDGTLTAAAQFAPLPVTHTPEELRGPLWRRALDLAIPAAYAGACADTRFTACNAGTRTRTFTNCAVGAATLDGSVSLAFSATPLCVLAEAGQSITRTADFTLTGLYGGTLAVTSPGGGQTLTKTAAGYTYAVGGMQRVLKGPAGRTVFDISTSTTTPLQITGSSRADLTIVSGALQVTHHLAGYAVTFTPSNLAWSAHCNCAVSGSLTGTVSGGKHDGKSATVTLKGCGEAEVTIGTETDEVTLDRCTAI